MSNVSSVVNTTAVAAATSQVTISSLQAQMALYSQAADGQDDAASADYKALQSAITANNVTDAQAALARLKRDSNSGSASPSSGTSPASPTASDAGATGSQAQSSMIGFLDATA